MQVPSFLPVAGRVPGAGIKACVQCNATRTPQWRDKFLLLAIARPGSALLGQGICPVPDPASRVLVSADLLVHNQNRWTTVLTGVSSLQTYAFAVCASASLTPARIQNGRVQNATCCTVPVTTVPT